MDIAKVTEEIRKRWKRRTDRDESVKYNEINEDKGTKTSGNWGHVGRPGEVGGSQKGGGHQWLIENRDTFRTNDGKDHATRWLKTSKKIQTKGPRETKKYMEEWQKAHPDVDLASEGSKYKGVLDTVKNFENLCPKPKKGEDVDGTYSPVPPHDKQELKRGFSLTFHQNDTSDNPFGAYDDDTYGQMCAVAMHELNGKGGKSYGTKGPYVGYFGNPEVSFVADDVDDALEFAVAHNQESVWDNKAQCELINPFYKAELNPIRGH